MEKNLSSGVKIIIHFFVQHKQSYIATWSNSIIDSNTDKIRRIYNETDYIIMGKSHIQNMADARSFSGTQFNSDH